MLARYHLLSFAPGKKIAVLACLVGTTGLLSGCLAKRDIYDVPEVRLTGSYHNAVVSEPGDAGEGGDGSAATKPPDTTPEKPPAAQVDDGASNNDGFAEWWRYLGSPELNRLIDRALANNADLRIATLRLVQTKENAAQSEAGLLPTLSAPAVVARQAPGGSVGIVPTGQLGPPQNAVQASLKADWRADVWGEQSAIAESANLQVRRAAFERDNVQSGVVASLAASYVDYLALNDRLSLARETEKVLTSTLAVMERRVAMGDATLGDLEQERATVFGLRAAIPSLEQQREDVLNGIALTVGALPGEFQLSEQGLDSLQLPIVEPGLPSALLLRRPDIRMMEARMLAADADIDVARARLLPPVDLSSQAGYSSSYLTPLFKPSIFFWSAVASLSATIFDSGRRKHAKQYSEAVYAEMVETYVRTIHQAMREVESSLAVVRLAGKRLESQQEAAAAAYRAWRISIKVFSMGGGDFMSLLDAERNFHRYSDDYQRARAESVKGYVALFHALGGGVATARATPGGGARPAGKTTGSVRAAAALVPTPEPERAVAFSGVDREGDGASGQAPFWQIELQGLYHSSAVSAAWRDLQARFPEMMEGRIVLPRLGGKADDEKSSRDSWYRLNIARFDSEEEAARYCRELQVQRERCRILSSLPNAKAQEVTSGSPGAALDRQNTHSPRSGD